MHVLLHQEWNWFLEIPFVCKVGVVCVCVLPPLRLPKISPSITKHSVHHMLYSTCYDLYITKNQCRSGVETGYNDVRLYRM